MGELNITISGFCTSVYGIIAGIPMRTVIPNAMAVHFGVIRLPGQEGGCRPVPYYLMPHIAMARDRVRNSQSVILTGAYLKILNAKNQPLAVKDEGFRLTEFKKDARLSPRVVYENDAAAYLDIFGGRVWTEGTGDYEPRVTRVNVKTEGTPKVSITPLPGSILSVESQIMETEELHVTNLDVEAAVEDTHFDFLGNFLVTEGGIPRQLDKRTPGMPAEPRELTLEHLGEKLKALGLVVETGGTVAGWRAAIKRGDEPDQPGRKLRQFHSRNSFLEELFLEGTVTKRMIEPVPLDQSCSPSQYP